MKKILPIILAFSAITIGAFSLNNNSVVLKAENEQQINYYDIGPAIFNPDQSGTPYNLFLGSNYSISYRNGALMVYPDNDYYQGISTNTIISTNDLKDTDLKQVRIYFNENTYQTLDELVINDGIKYNIYADAGYNVAFFLNTDKVQLRNIYKVLFYEGFTLPYRPGDHSIKNVLKQTTVFKYTSYHIGYDTDCFYSSSWVKSNINTNTSNQGEKDIVIEPIAAFTRAVDYRLHIRGNVNNYDTDLKDYDDGTCRLYLFFDTNDYNNEINNGTYNILVNAERFDVSEAETSYLTNLYDKIIFKNEEGEIFTLRQISNPSEKGLPSYNSSGEKGCLSFMIGNANNLDAPSYCANDFVSCTIQRGAQFPCYSYTNGGAEVEKRYQQIDDITITFSTYKYANWMTRCDYTFNNGNTQVISLGARDVTCETINGTVIDITLSVNNYSGLINQKILNISDNFTKYVYVNGRSLYYLYPDTTIEAYVNLDGKENTLSVVIPNLKANEIDELIVQRGAQIPAVTASSESLNWYGKSAYYYASKSISFDKYNTSSLTESSKIYWTLWFDGASPIRVSNASTFDFSENAPIGLNDESHRFVEWLDENGDAVSGYLKITSGKEYFSSSILLYNVTLKGLNKDITIVVDRFTRLTNVDKVKKYYYPTKSGYVFAGWVDENGDHYNFDNQILKDTVITATWRKANTTSTSGGCQGNICMSSILITFISLTSLLIILRKKEMMNKK